MKKFTIKIVLSFILFLAVRVFPNPIVELFINEIKVDSNGFFIELRTNFISSLDGWYLTSLSDTAYFTQGISIDSALILITKDSLQDHLSINPIGDIIGLHDPDYKWDEVRFGNVEYSWIASPKTGQSLCLHEYYDMWQHYYLYLDNTPSPGSENDSSGAMGFLQGTVVDSLERPVKGLEIIYDYEETVDSLLLMTITTDSNGYFILRNIAKKQSLWAKKDDSFWDFLLETQIYPEDTVTVKIYYNNLTSIRIPKERVANKGYQLAQNYPNPFNGSTLFSYALPYGDFIKISVFNVSGELIDILYSGYKTSGNHKVIWHPAGNISTGLYFYQLQTSELVLHKKCLYIK